MYCMHPRSILSVSKFNKLRIISIFLDSKVSYTFKYIIYVAVYMVDSWLVYFKMMLLWQGQSKACLSRCQSTSMALCKISDKSLLSTIRVPVCKSSDCVTTIYFSPKKNNVFSLSRYIYNMLIRVALTRRGLAEIPVGGSDPWIHLQPAWKEAAARFWLHASSHVFSRLLSFPPFSRVPALLLPACHQPCAFPKQIKPLIRHGHARWQLLQDPSTQEFEHCTCDVCVA